ncbi:peptidylprolyl isomerase [Dehalobacter sp. DCM]|uniref:foldase protein PrsA n=1 Tax=Dehalobacter sp. DCM TaxID=2907827 RepID=UPI0030821E2E|nr:peptidylprolyl isomerase [Dehalobacter sp. DCM]
MKKYTIALIIVISTFLWLSGCASQNNYAIKVNGKSVSKTVYEEKLNASKAYYEKQGMDFTTDEGKKSLETIKSSVLENMILNELIRQEVEKNKWDRSAPEVTAQIDDLKAQLKDAGNDYETFLKEQGMTEDEVSYYYTFTYNIGKDVAVSDEEIKQYFDTHYSSYGGQDEQVRASHILVATEAEAVQIIKDLNAGADFAALAKEKSSDGSAADGGDLGYFNRGDMVAEFENEAFSLNVDTWSQTPVKTRFGYHVILVVDHKEPVVPDFEKVKTKVAEDALANAQNLKIQSYYSDLKQNADVVYAEDLKPAE